MASKTIAINGEGLARLRTEFGIEMDQDLAARLGVNKGSLSRVLSGKTAPGPGFIASVLATFPVKFEAVFDVVIDDDDKAVA